MVKPTGFGFNSLAAKDNLFATKMPYSIEFESSAIEEWARLKALLEKHGIKVLSPDSNQVESPDKVFPNNWFSTHSEGSDASKLVLYPLKVLNRREERNEHLIEMLKQRYEQVWDLTYKEKESKPAYLESTGSLVLDRVHKCAYVAISDRSHFSLASLWAREMGYELYSFRTTIGAPIYHTNVMLSIGSNYAIACLECIECEHERKKLAHQLRRNHELIEISLEQMNRFCGNVIELLTDKGEKILAMSEQAYLSFSPSQKSNILKHVHEIVWSPVPTIEKLGGGGVRCMIAELF